MAQQGPTGARVVAAIAAAASFVAPFTMSREGAPPAVYEDIGGVRTGGYGHTGADVPEIGTPVSKAQRLTWLNEDLGKAGAGVARCVRPDVIVALPVATLGSLEDFTLNVGGTAFCHSRLATKLNAGDTRGACAEMSKWVYVRRKVVRGLVNARVKERALCERDLP